MILDHLSNLPRYTTLHPGLAAAARWVAETDLAALPPGRQEIDGERLYANVDEAQGRGLQGARLEAHREYIDLQIAVEGTDVMGWKPLSECRLRFHGYEEARDVELPDDPPDTWFSLPPGTFAIFLPDDAHAPLACKGKVRKVVVKVRVEA